ncbi:hypothetical protein AbraIFM66950_007937, partial [Aspergillus brasiliensis]
MTRINQKLDLGKLDITREAIYNSYDNEHEECHPGTRVELLYEVQEWARSAHRQPIFWLNGMAGTGKSTISRTVATRLDQQQVLGASFFFKRGEGDRGVAKKFFPTLIYQLVSKVPDLIPEVHKAIEDDQNISTQDLTQQFDKLIFQPLSKLHLHQPAPFVILIDALDECESEDKIKLILQLLFKLEDIKSVQLRVFLTSRPEFPIRLGFKNHEYHNLILHELPKTVVEDDIRLFLRNKLADIRHEHPLSFAYPLPPDWPGNNNIEKLVKMAVPLFIFAATLCRFIGDKDGVPDERLNSILEDKALTSTSALEKTYQPVLNQLLTAKTESEQVQILQDFLDIVGVIILLATPLPITAIARLTQIHEQKITVRLNRLYAVLNVPANVEAPVRILHLSFRDYLITTEEKRFRVDEKKTHTSIALHCIRVMNTQLMENICQLSDYGIQRESIKSEVINKHLTADIQYACRYWVYHIEQSGLQVEDGDAFHNVMDSHVLHWLEIMSWMRSAHEAINTLHILSRLTSNSQCLEFHKLIEEIRRFSLRNLSVIDQAPLQIYLSCLTFASKDSLIQKKFGHKVLEWLEYFPEIQSSWQLPFQILESQWSVQRLAFCSTTKTLAAVSSQGIITLWNYMTGQCILTLEGQPESLRGVAFSHDGAILSSIANKGIQLWNTETGTCISTLDDTQEFNTIALTSDGEKILTVTSSLMLCVRDLKNITEKKIINRLQGVNGSVIAISAQARTIAIWSSHSITTWDITEAGCRHKSTIDCTEQPNTAALSDDGRRIASSADHDIQVFDTTTDELLLNIGEHGLRVNALAFSTNNQVLASGSGYKISLWDLNTGQRIQTLNDHRQQVTALTFLGTSDILASGSTDCTIRLWYVSPVKALDTPGYVDRRVRTMDFSKDGGILAVAYKD